MQCPPVRFPLACGEVGFDQPIDLVVGDLASSGKRGGGRGPDLLDADDPGVQQAAESPGRTSRDLAGSSV
jgi:hypothetical protein